MRILKDSGNYQKNRAKRNLVLLICLAAVYTIVYLTSFNFLPAPVNMGTWAAIRVTIYWVLAIAIALSWRQYRRFDLGMRGERQVSRILRSSLTDEYYVINDLTPPDGYPNYTQEPDTRKRSNIDHIVLAPNGVFVVETKNHRGKITRGRINQSSSQAKANAWKVKTMISEQGSQWSIWVQPIVVFPKEDRDSPFPRIKDVEVTSFEKLPALIRTYTKGNYRFSNNELEKMGETILSMHTEYPSRFLGS